MDGTRIDSLIKDLRILQIPDMILHSLYDVYFAEYLLGKSFEQLYYIDALFPHRLYKVMEVLIRRKEDLHAKLPLLRDCVSLESEKEKMIKKLL